MVSGMVGASPPRNARSSTLTRWLSRLIFRLARRLGGDDSDFGKPDFMVQTYAGVVDLALEIAGEGQRVQTSAAHLALGCKALSDSIWGSFNEIDEVLRIAIATGEESGASILQIAEARSLLERCVGALGDRSRLVDGLVATLQRSNDGFRDVDASVTEVETLLAVIHDLGNQTNLLALNAAIEAAHSGVYGAGFNVVATEMRSLAHRTASATEQIRDITDRMRTSTKATSEAIQLASETGARSREQGELAWRGLDGCILSMNAVEATASRVAVAARRQTGAIEQINRNYDKLRATGRNGTWDADLAAEKTIRIPGLAADLCGALAKLGATEAETGQHGSRLQALRQTLASVAAATGEQTGLGRLEVERTRIVQAAHDLYAACVRQGSPSRRGRLHSEMEIPELRFGGQSVNLQNRWVDDVVRRNNLSATLFVLAEEDDGTQSFYRVASSLRGLDGKRAVGSQLNPGSDASQELLRGHSVYGYTLLLGRPHFAAYRPILDGAGEVIGAVYAGLELAAESARTQNSVELAAGDRDMSAALQWW